MRVLCTQIISPTTLARADTHPSIDIDEDYLVLSMLAGPKGVKLQILNDRTTPGWWDARMFMTVSASVPRSWRCVVDEGGVVHVGPEGWQRRGFWEDYYNQDPQAIADYEREVKEMLAEDLGVGDA